MRKQTNKNIQLSSLPIYETEMNPSYKKAINLKKCKVQNVNFAYLYHSLISASSYLVFFIRKSISAWKLAALCQARPCKDLFLTCVNFFELVFFLYLCFPFPPRKEYLITSDGRQPCVVLLLSEASTFTSLSSGHLFHEHLQTWLGPPCKATAILQYLNTDLLIT